MLLAAASGSAIRVEGDAKLEFVRGGRKCSMKFLDADVTRPMASVSAILDEGNRSSVRFDTGHVATGRNIPMCR